jgi:hypothetical protein
MDKEALELQQRLLEKIEEWHNSTDFGKGTTDKQKYVRAKGMLQATHPDVLTEVLGITSVPDVPREAMNRIRTMDLQTLKKLEIFRGLGDKVVGHHMSAFGAISGVLENQSPERRLELLNRAIDSGYITGMDPKGIGPIRTSIHRPIAHQGDFSGEKPGYKVKSFSNTDNIEDVWSAFESSLKQQKGSFFKARAHQSTQDLVAASKGVFGTDFITELDVPIDVRAQASKAADPLAKNLQNVISEFSGNSEQIENNAKRLIDNLDAKQQARIKDLQFKGGGVKFAGMSPKQLAQMGILSASVLGLGASAAETGLRTKQAVETGNLTDWSQAALSGASLVSDALPIAGELVSTPADAINVAIDTYREPGFKAAPNPLEARTQQLQQSLQSNPKPIPEPKAEAGYETLGRLGSEAANNLHYAGKQVLKLFGGAMRMGSEAGF